MQSFLSSAILLAAFSWFAIDTPARADEFSAVEHQRQTSEEKVSGIVYE